MVCGARLGQAEVPHLAGLDQLLDRAGDVLDRHVGVDPVLVEEVDACRCRAARSEASATCLMCSGRLFRPALLAVGVEVEAELGGDHDLVADRGERLAHQLLVDERPVDLGGVEEGDAALDGGPDAGRSSRRWSPAGP